MKRLLTLCLLLIALPAFAQDPATGFPPFGSFANGGFDAVNRANLDVNFAIPIMGVPGRGMSLGHAIVYDSLIWKRSGNTWAPVTDANGALIWGWKFDFVIGTLKSQTHTDRCYYSGGEPGGLRKTYNNYSYTDPAGTRHDFPDVYAVSPGCDMDWDGVFQGTASDQSGYQLVITVISGDPSPPTTAVYSPSGIKITDKLTDTNGNYISSSTASNVTTWKDTVGRDALKIDKSVANTMYYKYLDNSGNYQTITVALQTFSIKTNFACSGVVEYTGSASLPVSITFPGTPSNVTYSFTYEDSVTGYKSGRLKRVTLPTGGYYEYQYPTTGNKGIDCASGTGTSLTRVINDGSSATWAFTRSVALDGTASVTVNEPSGNWALFQFNSSAQLTSQTTYQGGATSTALMTIETAWAINKTPASRTVTLQGSLLQSKTETDFSSIGILLELREFAFGTGAPGGLMRKTTNTYAAIGYILDHATRVEIRDGAGTLKARTDIGYDETALTDCSATAPQHDDVNYGCTFTARGNPTSLKTYSNVGDLNSPIARHSTYDVFGNLRTADVGGVQQKQLAYSSTTQYAYPDSVLSGPSSGPQYTASATFNSYTGLVTGGTNVQGRTIQFAYDTLKRITTVTRPDGQQITYGYDDTNRIVTAESPLDGTNRVRQKTYFDTLGRAFKSQASDSSGNNCSETQAQYDNMGRAYKQSNPLTCGGTPSSWTQTAFDALGRVTSVTAPDNSVTSYSYTGATVTVTDPTGKARKTESDALGRLISVYEPDVNNNNALTQQTQYSYNTISLLTVISQGSQSRSYSYDDMGRLTSQTTPEAGQWQYQYNSFNQVTTRTDPRGVVASYSYDTLNRLTQVSYNVGATGVPATATVAYTYGSPSDTNADQRGRLVSVTDGPGSEGYTYDNLGRVTQFQKTISSTAYTTTYGYNLAGEITSITYPSGRVVAQSFDVIGRLTSISSGGGSVPYLNNFTYDPVTNLVTAFKYGNNAVDAAFTYSSDRLQLSTLSYKKVGDTNPFFSLGYSYGSATSNNGQIMGITDNVDSTRSMTYSYDALYRLKTATAGPLATPTWKLSWVYDRYGNRTDQNADAGSPPPPQNHVIVSQTTNRITDSGYSYDANGNMTADGRNALAYDAENRVLTNTYQSATTAYVYDGAGLRVKKCAPDCTNPTSRTVYVFSGSKVIAEYDNGAAVGSPTREYIYSGGALIATHEGGAVKFHYQEHLSMRVTSDSAGANRLEQGHFPYGESWYEGTGASKWKFTTYERDAESVNDYAMFRYHVNRLGRFNSPDPIPGSIGDPQSLNRYAYVLNDPCSLTDPLGLEPPCRLRVALNFTLPLDATAQSKAKGVLESIFKRAGVGVDFVSQGSVDYTLNVGSIADLQAKGFHIEGPAYGATGLTPNGKAIANYGAVFQTDLQADFSRYVKNGSPAQLGRAIGRVSAHEIGHFLLNTIGHDAFSGNIMYEGYPITDLVSRDAAGQFTFTQPQAEIIQQRCKKLREAGGGGGGSEGLGSPDDSLLNAIGDWLLERFWLLQQTGIEVVTSRILKKTN